MTIDSARLFLKTMFGNKLMDYKLSSRVVAKYFSVNRNQNKKIIMESALKALFENRGIISCKTTFEIFPLLKSLPASPARLPFSKVSLAASTLVFDFLKTHT